MFYPTIYLLNVCFIQLYIFYLYADLCEALCAANNYVNKLLIYISRTILGLSFFKIITNRLARDQRVQSVRQHPASQQVNNECALQLVQ